MSDVLAPPNPSSATPRGSSQDEQVRDVAVSVAAQGRTTTAASLRVASLTSRARFKRAAKTSAMLLGLAFYRVFSAAMVDFWADVWLPMILQRFLAIAPRNY